MDTPSGLPATDPSKIGQASFGDLVSLTADVVRSCFWPFMQAGMLVAVPAAVLVAFIQASIFQLIGGLGGENAEFPDPGAYFLPLAVPFLAVLVFGFVVKPVVQAVIVRGTLDSLSGGGRPLTEASDVIPWRRVIAADLVRYFFAGLAFALSAGGIIALLAGGLGNQSDETRSKVMEVIAGILVVGLALATGLFAMLVTYSRFGIAQAIVVTGGGSAREGLTESWQVMAHSTDGSFFGKFWVRYLLLLLTCAAASVGFLMLCSIPAQLVLSPAMEEAFEATGGLPDFSSVSLGTLLIYGILLTPAQALGMVLYAAAEGIMFADIAERLRPPELPVEDPESAGESPPAPAGFIPSA